MNLFRLAGDMTHLLSFVVLLLKIQATKSCAGAQWCLCVPLCACLATARAQRGWCRHLPEDAVPVHAGVFDALPGPLCQMDLAVRAHAACACLLLPG